MGKYKDIKNGWRCRRIYLYCAAVVAAGGAWVCAPYLPESSLDEHYISMAETQAKAAFCSEVVDSTLAMEAFSFGGEANDDIRDGTFGTVQRSLGLSAGDCADLEVRSGNSGAITVEIDATELEPRGFSSDATVEGEYTFIDSQEEAPEALRSLLGQGALCTEGLGEVLMAGDSPLRRAVEEARITGEVIIRNSGSDPEKDASMVEWEVDCG